MMSLGKLLAVAGLTLGAPFGLAAAGSLPEGSPLPPAQRGVNIGSGPKAPATEAPIEQLQMSSDLLAFGRQAKDPLALVVAARVMKATGGSEVERKSANDGAAQKSGQPVSPDSILAEARDLAKGDKIIGLLIDETATMRPGPADTGPKTHQDTVQPGATDVFNIIFSGGELAEVGIAGDGESDLDLFVYDENEHLVCRSAGSTDREYCRWWPRWTGPFRIEVQNLGGVANLFRLATN